jgi:hypothetical protein
MLRTTIQTTDEAGKELPIPPDLRAKVQRAADILADTLQRVGKVFDIVARWRCDRAPDGDIEVRLDLTSEGRGATDYEFPSDVLGSDEATARRLWDPIRSLIPVLSEEVDRAFDRIRRRRSEELVTTAGG